MANTYKGSDTDLLLKNVIAFRDADSASSPISMKFHDITIADNAGYSDDPTINTDSVLSDKRGCSDQELTASISSILCLNDFGRWMSLLWGFPSTSGSQHTWTLSNSDRPNVVMQLGIKNAQVPNDSIYLRYLGFILDSLSWDFKNKDQNISLQGIPAARLIPNPTSSLAGTLVRYAKSRACSSGGEIFDINGSSTLGRVSEGNVTISNNYEVFSLANNEQGYSSVGLGDPTIEGELTYLWGDDTSLLDYQENHTSISLTLVSRNPENGHDLTLFLPNVEFDKPSFSVATRKGLVQKATWRAHAGATAPTLTLNNAVTSYAS